MRGLRFHFILLSALLCAGGVEAQTGALVIASGASFDQTAVAMDSAAVIFGQSLAAETDTASGTPLPTRLAGTVVTVRDAAGGEYPARLFYVSPGQVNFLVPRETKGGTATVTVASADGRRQQGTILVRNPAPGLYSANANGAGVAAAVVVKVAADGSRSTNSVYMFDAGAGKYLPKPIDLGASANDQVVLTLFGTGFRFFAQPADVTVTVGGVNCEVLYAGEQGEFAGLDQVNVRLPRSLAGRGTVDVALTVMGFRANVVTVNAAALLQDIAAVSPGTARRGTTVDNFAVTGTNFNSDCRIEFSPPEGITVSDLNLTVTRLTARLIIDAGAAVGIRSVRVVSSRGPSESAKTFFVQGAAAPQIRNVWVSMRETEKGIAQMFARFDFEDSDGDILQTPNRDQSARFAYEMVSEGFAGRPSQIWTLFVYGLALDRAGESSGHVEFTYTYPWRSMMYDAINPGKAYLIDASGNKSEAVKTSSNFGYFP